MRSRPVESNKNQVQVTVFDGSTFTVAEILLFLGTNQKTGTVVVPADNERCLIRLVAGQVVEALSSQNPVGWRLGEILVNQGAVTTEQVNAFVAANALENTCLGRALTSARIVSGEDVLKALREQAQQLFFRCLELDGVTVEFHAGEVLPPDHDVAMDMTRALLEGMRRSDESRHEPARA